jgi:hypothetical protein
MDAAPIIERFRAPGITPAEVWDLPLNGRAFWQHVGSTRLAALREAGRSEPAIAVEFVQAITQALPLIAARLGAFDRVVLAGGLTLLGGFGVAGAAVLPGGVFCAAGAADSGAELVVDIGQTAHKLALGAQRVSIPRDLQRCPLVTVEHHANLSPQRRAELGVAACEFAAQSIARGLQLGEANSLWLALPVALDDALLPGDCTYPGWEGDAGLVRSMLARAFELAGRAPARVNVANDAELAALAARKAGLCSGRTLVLTLGFGPGAAVVEA